MKATDRAVRLEGEMAGSRAELDLSVLRMLEAHGPRPVDRLPYRWPLTRQHLRFLVGELVGRGLARWEAAGSDGRAPAVAITERGRRAVRSGRPGGRAAA